MDRAIWNSEEINIVDVVKDGNLETIINNAGKNHELLCPDPDCDTKFLQYCHGNTYTAYFRHYSAGNCDYSRYNQTDTPEKRVIRRKLYEHFSKDYMVQFEQKLIEHHFTPLLITKSNNSKLAIDFIPKNDLDKAEHLLFQYNRLNIPVCLIDINATPSKQKEQELSKVKRFILSQSNQKTVVAINPDELVVRQYKLDTNQYKLPQFSNTIFASDTFPLEYLTIEGKELVIKNFNQDFQLWLDEKQRKYKNELNRIALARKENEEREKRAQEIKKEREIISTYKAKDYVNENFARDIFISNSPNSALNDSEFYCHKCKRTLSMDKCVGIILPKTDTVVHGICSECINKIN